ncbi:MAG TPA: hypothetical protein H9713_08225, partial [Candidatus Mediterraneibacter surreyensis]|nr:hypothetical protein [Candidatus Mediterraneibacter surreyensis]
ERFPDETYYPYCFREDTCRGEGMSDKCDMCELPYKICKKLADYEDTGLTPDQIMELKERDTAKAPIDIEDDYGFFVCPSCGNSIYASDDFESHKFCLNCGQRIQWRE